MNYWKPQHEVFVRCMLKHEDPTKAYRTAYPKAKPASARVGGIRLYGYPHIRQRLEPVLHERRIGTRKKALEEGAAREQRENDRRMEMRRVLYKVVMKKLRRQRVFVVKGRQLLFEDDPSTNTILNAMVLDLRLEAGYNNWPVIERRFARIMASLLPREKRLHSVTNSAASLIVPVISSGAKQSVAQGEISREYAISHIAALQEIYLDNSLSLNGLGEISSPSGRNDALIVEGRPRTTISPSPLERGMRQPLCVSGVCRSSREAGFTMGEKREQTVTICPVNPAPTHTAAYQTAHINKAFVTKANCQQVYPPPRDIGLSSKSV